MDNKEIEKEIVEIFLKNQDLFLAAHKDTEKILKRSEEILKEKEKELEDKYFQGDFGKEKENKFLEEFKLIKKIILQETEKILEKKVNAKVDDLVF